MIDFNDPKYHIQQWKIGYKKDNAWKTILLPGDLSMRTIEIAMNDLNENYDITYAKQIMGVMSDNFGLIKKGEFLGL